MNSQTKVIIVTTNTDLIQRFIALEKSNNKNVVDSSEQNRSKSVKTLRRKSTSEVCVICGDQAIGYNYDVISCASCKAFFHRTGNEDIKRYKCLMNHEKCVIDYRITRKCYRCRLKRCFDMGMKREFLFSRDEIQRRKDNGRKRQALSIERVVHQNTCSNETENKLLKPVSSEDLVVIQNIHSAFLSVYDKECTEYNNLVNQQLDGDDSEIICCLQFNSAIVLRLIQFCRLIDHFEKLDADDRFILIKYNLLSLAGILLCYRRKSIDISSPEYIEYEEEVKREFYMLCAQSNYLFELIIKLTARLNEVIQHDHILLSLLLVIFLFSKGLSRQENEPPLKDPLSVYRAQSYYTRVLWNYLISKEGEVNTTKHLTKIFSVLFRMQSEVLTYKEFLSAQMRTLDAVDEIAPLMQTILHIS